MANGTEPIDLPIFFVEPKTPTANFAVWPRDTNSPFKIVLNGQAVRQDEPDSFTQASEAILKQCLRSAVESLGVRFPRIYEHINNLYYWRYKQIFATLRTLNSLLKHRHIATISLPTKRGPTRRFALNRGDEGPAILIRPEYEFPFYIESLGPQYIGSASSQKTLVGYLFTLRPWFLFLLRLTLSTAGIAAQKVRMLAGSLRQKPQQTIPIQSLAIARSWSQAERFSRIATELRHFDVNLVVLVDLTLFQAMQRIPTWVQTTDTTIFFSSAFFRVFDVFAAAKNCISNALRSPKNIPFRVTDGTNEIEEDFGSINFELELSHIDHDLHIRRLSRALKALKPVSLVSGESISPYIFSHGRVAKDQKVRSIRIQQVSVSAEDFVEFGDVDHLIFDDLDLTSKMKSNFPDKAETFEYLGHQNFVQAPEPRRLATLSHERPFSLTYFTQPLDSEGNRSIARSILKAFQKQIEKNELVFNIKLHPRDGTKYDDLPFINFIRGQESSTEILEKTDFAVSRSSSVLQDALSLGVPFLGVRLSPIDRSLVAPYFSNQLNAYVNSIPSFASTLENLDEYIDGFTHRREAFVANIYHPFAWSRLSSMCASRNTD